MRKSSIAKLLRRYPALATLGGLGLGLIGAGLLISLIIFVIQPLMTRETWDRTEIRGEHFTLWYHEESDASADADALLALLDTELDDLMATLEIQESEIPFPIDVFVHDVPAQLQQSISRRKGVQTANRAYGEIDLMVGEDPRQRLIETLLAFGWGELRAQPLYVGFVAVIAFPERDFHAVIAAAPERMSPSLGEILDREAEGVFEQTFYQAFDSPFSTRIISGFEGIRRLWELSAGTGMDFLDPSVEQAASLAQYLIETHGVSALRSVWGAGTTEVLLRRLTGLAIGELNRRWLADAKEAGVHAEDYLFQRVRLSMETGDHETAFELSRQLVLSDTGLDQDVRELIVRAALATGRFSDANRHCGDEQTEVCRLSELYSNWSTLEHDGIRICAAPEIDPEMILAKTEAVIGGLVSRLGIDPATLPAVVSVFAYTGEEDAREGRVLAATELLHRTMLHIADGDALDRELAMQLLQYTTRRVPFSRLLRRGIALAAIRPLEALESAARDLLETDQWVSLGQIDYGSGVPEEVVDTEIGYLFATLLAEHGADAMRSVWNASAEGRTLDTSLMTVLGDTRQTLEDRIVERAFGRGE